MTTNPTNPDGCGYFRTIFYSWRLTRQSKCSCQMVCTCIRDKTYFLVNQTTCLASKAILCTILIQVVTSHASHISCGHSLVYDWLVHSNTPSIEVCLVWEVLGVAVLHSSKYLSISFLFCTDWFPTVGITLRGFSRCTQCLSSAKLLCSL